MAAADSRPGKVADREIYYAVDLPRTRRTGELAFVLLERNTEAAIPVHVAARVTYPELVTLREETDRILLPMLQGVDGNRDWRLPATFLASSSASVFHAEVTLPIEMAEIVMPMLVSTGRLGLRKVADGPVTPLHWDNTGRWQLSLGLVCPERATSVEVVPRIERGAESIPYEEDPTLTPSGWIIWRNKIGLIDYRGGYGFVEGPPLKAPRAELQTLLASLYSSPALPPIILPSSLGLQETIGVPQPLLHVHSGTRPGGRTIETRLSAKVWFDYDGEVVAAGDTRSRIVRVDRSILIQRDGDAEARLSRRLSSLKMKKQPSGDFEFAPRLLSNVVRALVGDGWRVEADGTVYRRASHFQISVKSGVDWFDLSATADFEGKTIGLPELLVALRQGDGSIRLDDGTFGILPEAWLEKFEVLADLGKVEGDQLRFTRNQAGLLDVLVALEPDVQTDTAFDEARKALAGFDGVKPLKAPSGFCGTLRPYQEQGLGWFEFLRRFGFGGCLADDMGLGKTVQVLALVESRRQSGSGPTLVVVPKSLIWNWQQEAKRFVPDLRVLCHVGTERSREVLESGNNDLILTTYGTMRKDIAYLREIEFDYVILDEANAIKNPRSDSAQAARLLRGRQRLVLTGTPIENHLGDLWSLLDFLNPGLLGTARAFTAVSDGSKPTSGASDFLARSLRPFILRRTKEAVAPELPPKHEEILLCEMDPAQERLYAELRDHYRAKLRGRIETHGLARSKMHVLEALLRLRQAACHPGLVDKSRTGESSGKLDVLLRRLAEVRQEGHKALVFSQFTSFLAIVRQRLDAEKVPYAYLDGSTRDRQEVVTRFQETPDCQLFLVSLKAGGVGLNLTAADYVFILDPWWNPAAEAQAVDRAHRIGQDKHVFVYRLLCRETVEEKVAALQASKRDLAASLINTDNSLIRDLDRTTVEMLLG
jgi:superfamily II DNA or RNA helicase